MEVYDSRTLIDDRMAATILSPRAISPPGLLPADDCGVRSDRCQDTIVQLRGGLRSCSQMSSQEADPDLPPPYSN